MLRIFNKKYTLAFVFIEFSLFAFQFSTEKSRVRNIKINTNPKEGKIEKNKIIEPKQNNETELKKSEPDSIKQNTNAPQKVVTETKNSLKNEPTKISLLTLKNLFKDFEDIEQKFQNLSKDFNNKMLSEEEKFKLDFIRKSFRYNNKSIQYYLNRNL